MHKRSGNVTRINIAFFDTCLLINHRSMRYSVLLRESEVTYLRKLPSQDLVKGTIYLYSHSRIRFFHNKNIRIDISSCVLSFHIFF